MFLVRIDGVARMLSEQEYLSRHDFYLIIWDFLLIRDWLFRFFSRNSSMVIFFFIYYFYYFSMVQYRLLFSFLFFLFPFFCTAPFILNVKRKIVISSQIWRYRYVYVYYTCQIFFIFFIQILCKYLLISFFFYRNFYSSFSHCYEFKSNKTGI